jgi:hypothetical protein
MDELILLEMFVTSETIDKIQWKYSALDLYHRRDLVYVNSVDF